MANEYEIAALDRLINEYENKRFEFYAERRNWNFFDKLLGTELSRETKFTLWEFVHACFDDVRTPVQFDLVWEELIKYIMKRLGLDMDEIINPGSEYIIGKNWQIGGHSTGGIASMAVEYINAKLKKRQLQYGSSY